MEAITIALVGNPNCGKTSLFNLLTHKTGRVGNWPGVTVEQQSAHFFYKNKKINLIDLPGIYSFDSINQNIINQNKDEQITCEYLLKNKNNIDIVINVVDASNLERHLYLTTQLLQAKFPVIIALNKIDVATKRGLQFDLEQFKKSLHCPIIPIISNSSKNSSETLDILKQQIIKPIIPLFQPSSHSLLKQEEKNYNFIDELIKKIILPINKNNTNTYNYSKIIDRVVLNQTFGIPIFFTVMYLLFWFALNIGGALQNFINTNSHIIFINKFQDLLNNFHIPAGLITILANGLGEGITTLIGFIPVLGIMFLFLSFLEDSGYMTRAAFIMDRITSSIGLPGKSFIPMILGFACNVPAVMAARTLGSRRDQILTVMMTPFMSCTARLAIYAVFAAVFFPHFAASSIFCLYLLGIVVALLTGLLLQKTLLHNTSTLFIMELPNYHWPQYKSMLRQTWQRLGRFLWRAGKLILPVCVLMSALNTGGLNFMPILGHKLTPLFSPMGIHADNWPATVSLITGVLAKEVVIATLNTLYQPGQMLQQFDGAAGAFAYLIFVLLYFPCISTIAVVARELGKKWACFSVAWSTIMAYSLAVLFYQLVTIKQHVLSTVIYMGIILGFISIIIFVMRRIAYYSPFSPLNFTRSPSLSPAGAGLSSCGKCQQCK